MVKTPYGIINMTSSSGGGGSGPAGEGWERILLNSADTTSAPYTRVASIDSETPGATGETTVTMNLGDPGGVGALARYITAADVYYYDISKDWATPRLWEFFFEFSGYTVASDLAVYMGISFNDVQASISNNTVAGGIWASPRGAAGQNYAVRFYGTTHGQSARTVNTANNVHSIIQQPVGSLGYGHIVSVQNDSYDLIESALTGRITSFTPASNTDPLYIIIGLTCDRVGGGGTAQESFRLWYRVTEDYFTWS